MAADPAPGPSGTGAPTLSAPTTMPIVGRERRQLAFPLDGRYGAMDPLVMVRAIEWLVKRVDVTGIDYVLGIPEGGYAPAYAFAAQTGLRVVFATVWQPDADTVVSFREEHDRPPLDMKYVYGLSPGDSVIIVEDEVTSGRTVVNCVRALRARGIHCDQVASLYASDDGAMRERLAAEGVRLRHVARFAGDQLYP